MIWLCCGYVCDALQKLNFGLLWHTHPGTFVTQVSATDMDDAVNSYNGVITYSLAIQTPTKPQSQMFAIDNKTGVISLNKPGLDRTVSGWVLAV